MERVTAESDVCGRVLDLLRGAYLTGAEAQRVRCAVAEAVSRGACRQMESDRAAVERVRQKLAAFRDRAAPGAEPPRVWSEELEAEAVLQGQDGPDPEYVVAVPRPGGLAPRFGGVEMRAVSGDRPEGMPDSLAPVYAIQAQQAALTEQDRCPLTGDVPADPDDDGDDDDTPIVPFTDEQEGE